MERRNLWLGIGLVVIVAVLVLAWVRGGDRDTRTIEYSVPLPEAAQ